MPPACSRTIVITMFHEDHYADIQVLREHEEIAHASLIQTHKNIAQNPVETTAEVLKTRVVEKKIEVPETIIEEETIKEPLLASVDVVHNTCLKEDPKSKVTYERRPNTSISQSMKSQLSMRPLTRTPRSMM